KYYSLKDTDSDATFYSSRSDKSEENANETDDVDESDMDLSDDNPHGDDDDARYEVFMHNKYTVTPNSTYLCLMVISSSLDFIQTLLDETPANELTDFMSHPVYTDAQTTSVVHNPEENPELTSYISGVSKVPFGTHVYVLATKTFMQEMFLDENAHRIPSLPKLEALTNFNVFKAFEKSIQAKVLTEIKKLLPTHIPNAITNYVKPRLNTSILEVMKTNQINLFTQPSTSTDDLLEIYLKLKLLNRIPLNKSNNTYITHQQLYDTLYESIILDQHALDAQAVQSSFHKRSHDNQDPPNNREGENKKKHIDKDENHILEPSTVAIANKFKELIQKDELTIANFEGAGFRHQSVLRPETHTEFTHHETSKPEGLRRHNKRRLLHLSILSMDFGEILQRRRRNSDEGDVFKPISFKRHMLKSTKPHTYFYNNDYSYLVDLRTEEKYTTSITKHYVARYYKEGIENRIPERWSKEVCRYHFEALNGDPMIESMNSAMQIYLKSAEMMLKTCSSNKRLKVKDWTDYDVKSSKEMLKNIDEILRHREQLRRLEEYVGGRPKTVNPCTFVRPL
ncbi:hypothetical protein Tco_1034479, partial [Tanacetum coccineum]